MNMILDSTCAQNMHIMASGRGGQNAPNIIFNLRGNNGLAVLGAPNAMNWKLGNGARQKPSLDNKRSLRDAK